MSSMTSKPSISNHKSDGDAKSAAAGKDMPLDLDFSQVIKNRTRAPCSLNDFMDYLVYVEHNAENLQFFLWYCDYVQRWSRILPRQKALSPVWDPESAMATKFPPPVVAHKKAKSVKLTNILAIMERDSAAKEPVPDDNASDSETVVSRPSSQSYALESPISASSRPPDWQPYTIQPFRDEMTRIARHYIAESSPRQLKLSVKDRNACLQALQHTTHPSALLPAFTMADSILRDFSHPSFVAWSMSNCNRPRIIFLRVLAATTVLLGVVLDLFFILSRSSQYFRIVSILLWWPGATALLAACRGLCLLLHIRASRELRPWEQFDGGSTAPHNDAGHGHIDGATTDNDSDADAVSAFSFPFTNSNNNSNNRLVDVDLERGIPTTRPNNSNSNSNSNSHKQHSRKDTSTTRTTISFASSGSGVDPLRKPSMQTMGPSNDVRGEPWVGQYACKHPLRRVFERSVPTRNRDLQLLQDRIVLQAVVVGGFASAVLTIISLFLPSGNLYL